MERHYGKRPIIYTTVDFYEAILSGGAFSDYPIWVRSTKYHPAVKYGSRAWAFWQYQSDGQTPGINGNVDRDVFYGTKEQWDTFLREQPSGARQPTIQQAVAQQLAEPNVPPSPPSGREAGRRAAGPGGVGPRAVEDERRADALSRALVPSGAMRQQSQPQKRREALMPLEGEADLKADALLFHSAPRPGKLEIVATKPLANQRDLALAYSPGVAFPCEAIAADPHSAAIYTARQNLVAVLSNGTAVLGLGAIGPLAAKPVMEGKAVLFKKFAGIDVFDIEVAELNVDKLVDVIVALEPTFGGINLEDIKGPECFEVEEKAKARMGIPVFHDDQHGTAIIVSAAIVNALELTGKRIGEVKIVCSGAGAAALASLNLLVSLGASRDNIIVCDIEGVVYKGRKTLMDRWKEVYARDTSARTLADAIPGADIFLGLSAGGVLKPEMLKQMASDPLVMALANPNPEIMPELALETRPDAMICTGRSDYPNQVNNVLCFPYIFRGALDVVASEINEAMKKAAVAAIAALARETPSEVAAQAYGGQSVLFGKTSLIPSPFDPRLMLRIAPAVARAAMESGVARRPIADFDAYRRSAQPLRLPFRLHHEAAVRQGAGGDEDASFTPKARTNACCGRPRWCWRSSSPSRS